VDPHWSESSFLSRGGSGFRELNQCGSMRIGIRTFKSQNIRTYSRFP
jgi:hypothetical protein